MRLQIIRGSGDKLEGGQRVIQIMKINDQKLNCNFPTDFHSLVWESKYLF